MRGDSGLSDSQYQKALKDWQERQTAFGDAYTKEVEKAERKERIRKNIKKKKSIMDYLLAWWK